MPVTLGSGVTCSIHLTEPNIFLSGFDAFSHDCFGDQNGTALLRGTLRLYITRNTKIKSVQLKLLGHTRIEWPTETEPGFNEEGDLQTQSSTPFNAIDNQDKNDFGFQCRYWLQSTLNPDINLAVQTNAFSSLETSHHSNAGAKRSLHLSLNNVQTQCHSRGNSITSTTELQHYKTFYPGIYDYAFEFPIAHHQLETIKVPHGSVAWELRAAIARAGIFNTTLYGRKEVTLVRVPDPLSLETMQPIFFSRRCEDWLHYDIIISGKSFPIGSFIPIFIGLRPMEKVKVHGFEMFVTESIEYWSDNRKVTRKSAVHSVLLLSKKAEKTVFPSWATSSLLTVRHNEFTPEPKNGSREMATEQGTVKISEGHTSFHTVAETGETFLDNSDLGIPACEDMTEIEAGLQIPTCRMMSRRGELRLYPKCVWKNVIAKHCVKIVLHISRPDTSDPTGKRRLYRDTSISLPITLLNCRANQANMSLPSYSHDRCQSISCHTSCGCPDALTNPIEKRPRYFIGAMATRHLVNSRSSIPHTTSFGRASLDQNFNLCGSDITTRPPSVSRFINEEPPPRYDDIVGVTRVTASQITSPV